jgi:hypothetical protein
MCSLAAENEARIEEWRKARKAHDCAAVGCDINVRPGDRYHIVTYIGDGEVRKYKHCPRCWAICEALWNAGAEGIDLELNCGEEWTENWSAAEPAHLAFMTADEAQAQLAGAKS